MTVEKLNEIVSIKNQIDELDDLVLHYFKYFDVEIKSSNRTIKISEELRDYLSDILKDRRKKLQIMFDEF